MSAPTDERRQRVGWRVRSTHRVRVPPLCSSRASQAAPRRRRRTRRARALPASCPTRALPRLNCNRSNRRPRHTTRSRTSHQACLPGLLMRASLPQQAEMRTRRRTAAHGVRQRVSRRPRAAAVRPPHHMRAFPAPRVQRIPAQLAPRCRSPRRSPL